MYFYDCSCCDYFSLLSCGFAWYFHPLFQGYTSSRLGVMPHCLWRNVQIIHPHQSTCMIICGLQYTYITCTFMYILCIIIYIHIYIYTWHVYACLEKNIHIYIYIYDTHENSILLNYYWYYHPSTCRYPKFIVMMSIE